MVLSPAGSTGNRLPSARGGPVRTADSIALVRGGEPQRAVDRLLMASLIEARSCERFRLLSEHVRPRDSELADFYAGLFESEARHHTTYVQLAEHFKAATWSASGWTNCPPRKLRSSAKDRHCRACTADELFHGWNVATMPVLSRCFTSAATRMRSAVGPSSQVDSPLPSPSASRRLSLLASPRTKGD